MAGGVSKGLDGAKGKLSSAFGRVGDRFKSVLVTKGLTENLQVEVATDKLEAQLGGGPWASGAAGVSSRLYQDAFGDNMAEVADGVRQVLQAGLVPENS